MLPRRDLSCSALMSLLLAVLLLAQPAQATDDHLLLGAAEANGLLGQRLYYLQESAGPLSWRGALAAFERGDFQRSERDTPGFGIGSAPVWLTLAIDNPSGAAMARTLLLDTPWIDQVEVYLVQAGHLVTRVVTGDAYPDTQAGQGVPGFRVPLALPAGESRLLVRLSTADPLIVPLYLLDSRALETHTLTRLFTYGLSYGYLLALMFYNATLALGIRDRRHLLYALYLGVFTLTNFSYTGFGATWLWGEAVVWQRWAQPLLIWCFGASGLLFATSFLDLRRHWPDGRRLAAAVAVVPGAGVMLGILTGQQTLALLSAFGFMTLFTALMLLLGIISVRRGIPGARCFLTAISAGAIGTILTTLSTWGVLPGHELLFRTAEVGMLLEATLLALALAARLRQVHAERVRAEADANTDALTQLSNRRALYRHSEGLWSQRRQQQALSLVVLDIDHFKHLNDRFGHSCGDEVLRQIGGLIARSTRGQDVAARWGGEEFTILLDHCNIESGVQFAERLRGEIAAMVIVAGGQELYVTASFGVAQVGPQDGTLDALIERADQALYRAKREGRNRVCSAADSLATGAPA